jgi:hypothetical protein
MAERSGRHGGIELVDEPGELFGGVRPVYDVKKALERRIG